MLQKSCYIANSVSVRLKCDYVSHNITYPLEIASRINSTGCTKGTFTFPSDIQSLVSMWFANNYSNLENYCSEATLFCRSLDSGLSGLLGAI